MNWSTLLQIVVDHCWCACWHLNIIIGSVVCGHHDGWVYINCDNMSGGVCFNCYAWDSQAILMLILLHSNCVPVLYIWALILFASLPSCGILAAPQSSIMPFLIHKWSLTLSRIVSYVRSPHPLLTHSHEVVSSYLPYVIYNIVIWTCSQSFIHKSSDKL